MPAKQQKNVKRRTVVRNGQPVLVKFFKKDIPRGLNVLVKPGKSVRIEPCRCFDCQILRDAESTKCISLCISNANSV